MPQEYYNGYYIGFNSTGIPEVDAILKHIARAGKAYHNTDGWTEKVTPEGKDYCDMIQDAANECAIEVRRLRTLIPSPEQP